ncbi:MAG TPA: hypothetical protein VH541_04750 [Gaiellaceae bacterium]|jgi:hypothetical protein
MEPRHQEREADQLAAERAEEATDEARKRRGQDEVRIKDDDTRHEASADEETQI